MRSYSRFTRRLGSIGILGDVEKIALAARVSLRELYDGDRAPSIIVARRAVYLWLKKEGKSINEIAEIFDRQPSGVWKLTKKRSK